MVKSEKIGFLRQDPGFSDLILARGQIYPGKGSNENVWACKCYLGPHFSKLALKEATWQPGYRQFLDQINSFSFLQNIFITLHSVCFFLKITIGQWNNLGKYVHKFVTYMKRIKKIHCSQQLLIISFNLAHKLDDCNDPNHVKVFRTTAIDWRCEKIKLFPPRLSNRTLLASYPGSGNTWIRYLLERATGYYTGSAYRDVNLINTGNGVLVKR